MTAAGFKRKAVGLHGTSVVTSKRRYGSPRIRMSRFRRGSRWSRRTQTSNHQKGSRVARVAYGIWHTGHGITDSGKVTYLLQLLILRLHPRENHAQHLLQAGLRSVLVDRIMRAQVHLGNSRAYSQDNAKKESLRTIVNGSSSDFPRPMKLPAELLMFHVISPLLLQVRLHGQAATPFAGDGINATNVPLNHAPGCWKQLIPA